MRIYLCVQFLVLSSAIIWIRLPSIFVPDMNDVGHYRNTYQLMLYMFEISVNANSSFNILVYYFKRFKQRH